jgi:hypothetical protein
MLALLATMPANTRDFVILDSRSDMPPDMQQVCNDDKLDLAFSRGKSLVPQGATDDEALATLNVVITGYVAQLKMLHELRTHGLLAAAAARLSDADTVTLKKLEAVAPLVGVVGRTRVKTLTPDELSELHYAAAANIDTSTNDKFFTHCVAKFVVSQCDTGAYLQKTGDIFKSFVEWLRTLPVSPAKVTIVHMKSAMKRLHFKHDRHTSGQIWHGLRLHPV